MRIITTILFFSALVYYLVQYTIRFIRFLKRTAGNKEADASGEMLYLDIPTEVLAMVFPGGEEEIDRETNKLYLCLQKAQPKELVKLVLVGGAVYFAESDDKSERKLIDYIQNLSQSSLTVQESKLIHDFIYLRVLRSQFDQEINESTFNFVINDIDQLTGCDEDEIPGREGAFGLALSNPIPVKGIIFNEYYLIRLRTQDGMRITWQRIGSRQPSPSEQPVDIYQIFDLEDTPITKLYLSPYHKRVSNKAPKGFKLLTKNDLAGAEVSSAEANRPESPISKPTMAHPEEDDRELATFIFTTTDQEGNEEIEVHDPRLLSASLALLAASAATLIPDLEKAEESLKTAIANMDDFPGPDDAKTVSLLRDIAQLAEQFGEAATAERFLERALKAQLKRAKTDKEVLSDTQHDLSILLMAKGDLTRAEALLHESLQIRQQLFGLEHEKTAQVLLTLGMVLEQRPFTEEVETLFRQALPVFRKIYGDDHLQTALILNYLSRTLLKESKLDEALPLAEKAYAVLSREDCPEKLTTTTISSMSTLAMIYKRLRRLAEAESLQRQLVATIEKVYGPEHESFGVELGNLAGILVEKGEEEAAMKLFYQALYVKEENMDSNHPSIAHTLINLASFHAKNGEFIKAEPLAKRSYQILTKALGDFHPQTQKSFSLWQKIRADKKVKGQTNPA